MARRTRKLRFQKTQIGFPIVITAGEVVRVQFLTRKFVFMMVSKMSLFQLNKCHPGT